MKKNVQKICIIEKKAVPLPPKLHTMRTHARIILFVSLLSILGVQPAFGYTKLAPEMHHFMWASVDFGYSSLLNQAKTISNPHGFSPSIAGGYRLYFNDFLFQTGLSLRYGYYEHQIPNDHLKLDMIDTEGDPFVMHALVTGCKDVTHVLDIGVPIFFGWDHKKIYLLAGLTPSVVVLGRSKSTAELTTYGEYDQFMDDFYSMHNHAFVDNEPIAGEWQKLPYNLSLTGHAEFGLRLDEFVATSGYQANKHKIRYYLALFADAGGLLSFSKKDEESDHLLYYNETKEEGLKFYVTPALLSSEMQKSTIVPLTVGVKFTCLFALPDEPRQKIYDSSTKKVERNNTQVIR